MDMKIGLENKTENYSGLEIALLANYVKDSRGANFAELANGWRESSYGVNGGVNVAELANGWRESSYGVNGGVKWKYAQTPGIIS